MIGPLRQSLQPVFQLLSDRGVAREDLAVVATFTTSARPTVVFDVERDVSSRLTFDEANDAGPVWSPDGSRIAFASSRDAGEGIYVRSASGRGAAELLYASEQRITVEDWSPDGKHIAFNSALGKADLWILAVDEGEASSFYRSFPDVPLGPVCPVSLAGDDIFCVSCTVDLKPDRFS